LWLEMRFALSHVELPERPEALAGVVSSVFSALTGNVLSGEGQFHVDRLSRGGMSSGAVSGEFWTKSLIPQLVKRLTWLHETWGR